MKPILTIHTDLLSSKNSRPIYINQATGNRFLGKRAKVKLQEKDMLIQCSQQKDKFLEALKTVEPPYHLLFYIYRQTKRRFDYLNIIQGLADVMVKAGLISDDNASILTPYFRFGVDKIMPRTEIYLITDCQLTFFDIDGTSTVSERTEKQVIRHSS